MSRRLFYVRQDVQTPVRRLLHLAGRPGTRHGRRRPCHPAVLPVAQKGGDGHAAIEFHRERVEAWVLAEQFDAAVAAGAADPFGVLCLTLGRDHR